MPKVLILSDSHGWEQEVEDIKQRHQEEVDAMIHCGDSELAYDSDILEGFHTVQGNMDLDSRFPEEIDVEVGNLHFFVTHGHLFQVKSTLMPLSYRAEELGANVICFGHSHVAGVEKQGDQLFINPGSIRLPRSSYPGSYAILTATDDLKEVSLRYFTKDGQAIDKLSYLTSLAL
ncbi:metallophosphoesterase [Gracilibacillus sp. YIM 98692]|uniref:metallophosphoesterase family protein n=1 Tax=Gracilibacillus sp. YIM 98692 TaxID=2663532 RepID=UPI0013D2E033|nr:metallophosphoesterase [Gracilibacillus sp. YIM 98692]